MNIFFPFLIGVIGSLVASIVFLFFIRQFRPEIAISDRISVWSVGANGERSYNIKILNKRKRSAIDLRFELLLMELESVPGGVLRKSTPIDLGVKSRASILPKYAKSDKEAAYARRIVITKDLNEIWTNDANQYIIFRVYCQDEVSGFSKLFEKEYRTKRNSIINGQFHFGNNFEIS